MKPISQLHLNLSLSIPIFAGINSPTTYCREGAHAIPCTGESPEITLGQMVVDDRVFKLGKTTWRNLIDTALSTGHTEIYESEEGEFGLRKPGFRFGPIAALPEFAVSYVRERVAVSQKRRIVTKR